MAVKRACDTMLDLDCSVAKVSICEGLEDIPQGEFSDGICEKVGKPGELSPLKVLHAVEDQVEEEQTNEHIQHFPEDFDLYHVQCAHAVHMQSQ